MPDARYQVLSPGNPGLAPRERAAALAHWRAERPRQGCFGCTLPFGDANSELAKPSVVHGVSELFGTGDDGRSVGME